MSKTPQELYDERLKKESMMRLLYVFLIGFHLFR